MRVATPDDAPGIAALMRASVLELFPRYYDERQTASAAVHIAHIDLQLIEDRTYYVEEEDGEIIACGGWSRRNKLFSGRGDAAAAGFSSFVLGATLPGEQLYRAFGFVEDDRFDVEMPDGVKVECVAMHRSING